jgi:uncharacterized protein (DUF433 family)
MEFRILGRLGLQTDGRVAPVRSGVPSRSRFRVATGILMPAPTAPDCAASATEDSACPPGAIAMPAGSGYRKRVSQLERITSDPAVCHGQPTIRGLRYTVENLVELLSAGMTIDEVLADYPDLERDDILAALEFGAHAAGRRVVPLSAA